MKPPGDVVVADVLRERANAVVEAVADLGVDREAPRPSDAVVWEELSSRVQAEGTPSVTFCRVGCASAPAWLMSLH